MRPCVAPLLLLSLALVSATQAARSVSADRPVAVTLEPTQPTAVALPEPVASVSVGLAPERFSLDYDGAYLFLLPLDSTIAGRLFVVGQSGKLYVVTFKVGTPADDVVHVTHGTPDAKAGLKPQPLTVSSFLRAVRTGKALPEQQPADVPPPALGDTRLSLVDTQAVARGSMIGLVLRLRNTQTTPLTLDVRVGLEQGTPAEGVVRLSTWTWPPTMTIRAVAVEDEIVGPDGQTRVYVILERRP
jgi:hypothetical protein